MAMEKKKRDPRRWVIMTLRNNGATEAQFPLPVGHNGIRLLMERDVPVLAPAFYAEGALKGTALIRFEEAKKPISSQGGVRSMDEAGMVELQYAADILELPDQYQTIEGIEEFVRLMSNPATILSGYEEYANVKVGLRDNHPLSIQLDQELKAKAAIQAAVAATAPATETTAGAVRKK